MGVHQFMLGRELPCTVADLLEIRLMPLAGQTHDALVKQVEGGRAYPDVLYRLGLSHLGRQALAHELSQERTDLFAHHRLAAIYLAHNQLQEAVEHHRAILEQEPQEQAVRTSLGHLLQLLGRHKEAVWEYEKALCLDPDNWDLQMELAEQFERMGNSDAAISRLRNLCEVNPSFPDLHLRLANLYSTRGEDRLATTEYAEALSVHPDYLECHIAAARHELKMGRTDKALEYFQRAVTINN